MIAAVRQWLMSWLNLPQIGRCLLVLLPILFWSRVSGDQVWLRAAIMAVATLIGFERAGLAPLGVLLQGLAASAGFLLLYFSLQQPLAFVLAAAVMAAMAIGLAAFGRKLRSLGNFIFIPALYLACETAEGAAPDSFAAPAWRFLPYMLICMLPVLLLSFVEHHRAGWRAGADMLRHHLRLGRGVNLGERLAIAESMLAVALAVALAAAMVEYWHLGHGQWVIWSAASVVTGDAATAHAKLRDRATGALLGVPSGVFWGLLLPHNSTVYALIALCSVLTLVAFRRYVQGFATRCACVAAALIVANQSAAVAAERVENVLLGGVIGVAFVFGLHLLLRHRSYPDVPV